MILGLDLLRRARGWLTGLNAVSARFDLLQNKTDALLEVNQQLHAALATLAYAMRSELGGLAASSQTGLSDVLRLIEAETRRHEVAGQVLGERLDAQEHRTAGVESELAALRELAARIQQCLDDAAGRADTHAGLREAGEASILARLAAQQTSLDERASVEQAILARLDALDARHDQRESAERSMQARLADHDARLEQRSAELVAHFETHRVAVDAALVSSRLAARRLVRSAGGARSVVVAGSPRTGERRLGFLLQSLELVNHFAAVWDLIPPDSFDVVLHGVEEATGREAVAGWDCGVCTTAEVLASGLRYACLVSNHPVEGGGSAAHPTACREQRAFHVCGG